jgi:tetratricopeptide (TPR) repeat protein
LDKIYSDDVQNELAFKMSILHDTRIKEGILKYSDKIKNSEDIENIEKWFYFSLFSKNNESMVPIVKELKKVNNKWYVYAFVFYFYTNNEEVKQFLQEEEMVSPLLDVLDGKSKKIKLEEDKVFIDILNEMLELKEYVVSEKLLSEEEIFHAKTLKNIGNVFYTHLKDGLAIEYYTKYLREYKADDETFTKTAELLLYSECFEEAILFAEQALQLNQKNFKPVEVLIESCKALSLKEAVDELCKSALKAFPDSPYILSNMENEA